MKDKVHFAYNTICVSFWWI